MLEISILKALKNNIGKLSSPLIIFSSLLASFLYKDVSVRYTHRLRLTRKFSYRDIQSLKIQGRVPALFCQEWEHGREILHLRNGSGRHFFKI